MASPWGRTIAKGRALSTRDAAVRGVSTSRVRLSKHMMVRRSVRPRATRESGVQAAAPNEEAGVQAVSPIDESTHTTRQEGALTTEVTEGTVSSADDAYFGCELKISDGRLRHDERDHDLDDIGARRQELSDADAVEGVMLLGALSAERSAVSLTIDIAVAFGAAEMGAPTNFYADYPVKPSAGSWHGAGYRTAGGAIMANRGEKRAAMSTVDGPLRMVTRWIADVTKPLAPAGRITAKGHDEKLTRSVTRS